MGKKILWTSFYQDKNPARHAELEHCIRMNIQNPFIDEIRIALEGNPDDFPLLKHEKIKLMLLPRATFRMFFNLMNETTGPDDISILSNTDIFFDHTLALLDAFLDGNTCFALSRWHTFPDGRVELHNERFSQDVWIFRGHVRHMAYCDFFLGIRGCDNRIAYEILQAGYKVVNPSMSIKAIHYHMSEIRNYGKEFIKQPYHPVYPCAL